jgi:hypothetical protein
MGSGDETGVGGHEVSGCGNDAGAGGEIITARLCV